MIALQIQIRIQLCALGLQRRERTVPTVPTTPDSSFFSQLSRLGGPHNKPHTFIVKSVFTPDRHFVKD